MKKPFYKTWWFAAIMAILVLFILGTIGSIFEEEKPKEELVAENSEEDDTQEKTEKEAQEEKIETSQDDKQEIEKVEDEETDSTEENLEVVDEENPSEWDELKGEIIGKSDKDFKTLTNSNPSELNNDTIGNRKIITISESVPIEEYALSYNEAYINEKETHFIVNSKDGTTTVINNQDGLIYLDIKEYVEKEEEDANILGSGMVLSGYIVYPDGDIEKIK